MEINNSQHLQVIGNTGTGLNDDGILLETFSDNPQRGMDSGARALRPSLWTV